MFILNRLSLFVASNPAGSQLIEPPHIEQRMSNLEGDESVRKSTKESSKPEQIIIGVVGVTGSGKSSLIQRLTQRSDSEIGDGLDSGMRDLLFGCMRFLD